VSEYERRSGTSADASHAAARSSSYANDFRSASHGGVDVSTQPRPTQEQIETAKHRCDELTNALHDQQRKVVAAAGQGAASLEAARTTW
jgi:cob(I)alamin adenosyltransferase